jgi:hypothetical protein
VRSKCNAMAVSPVPVNLDEFDAIALQ